MSAHFDGSGQPRVESGQSADENQVSRTSGSRLKPAASSAAPSASSRRHTWRSCSPFALESAEMATSAPSTTRDARTVARDDESDDSMPRCDASALASPRFDHTGMRCPHHSWREMHQSRMFSCHIWKFFA